MSVKSKKTEMNYKNQESLEYIRRLMNEVSEALGDPTRTIKESPISDVLGGAIGMGAGGAISFATLFYVGTTGLSAVGITSGLAGAGALVGGGMVAGIGVLAAPIAIMGIAGAKLVSNYKDKKLKEEKELLYQEALKKHQAIINMQKNKINASKERAEYLEALNISLRMIIKELCQDLGKI